MSELPSQITNICETGQNQISAPEDTDIRIYSASIGIYTVDDEHLAVEYLCPFSRGAVDCMDCNEGIVTRNLSIQSKVVALLMAEGAQLQDGPTRLASDGYRVPAGKVLMSEEGVNELLDNQVKPITPESVEELDV